MPPPKHKLNERDTNVLVDLYKYRFLTAPQIRRLHFPSMQTTYRRLRLLKVLGLVEVFAVANVEESVFMLGKAGLLLVAQSLGVEKNELRRIGMAEKPRDYYFMQHFLEINDFRITLKEACQTSGVHLLGFIPDYYGEKTPQGNVGKYLRDVVCDIASDRESVSHTPDGVFALNKDGASALFFLEIDRGTEVVSNPDRGVLKSLRFYSQYLLSGKYQRYEKDFGIESFKGFRCLIVTSAGERINNFRTAASSIPVAAKVKRFVWAATRQDVTSNRLFQPIWRSIDEGDDTLHSVLGGSKQ